MSDSLSLTGLFIALVLPWVCGSLLVHHWLAARATDWNLGLVIGHGYLLGVVLAAQLMRGIAFVSGHLGFWPVVALLVLLSLLLVRVGGGLRRPGTGPPGTGPPGTGHIANEAWQRVATAFFMVLIALQLGQMAQEVTLRPLYPWDAWMNWAPKSIVWWHRGELVEFLNPPGWLAAADGNAYTLGNWRASGYPEGLPLIWLWVMQGAGVTAHPLLQTPWLALVVALACACYGHLRLAALTPLAAAIGVYLLLSIPYLGVHTMLAGYADLWLAAAFALAGFALHARIRTGSSRYLALAALYVPICVTLKQPGLMLAALVLLFGVLALFRLRPRNQLLLLVLVVLAGLLLLWRGVVLPLGPQGDLMLSLQRIHVPGIVDTELTWHPVAGVLARTLLAMINWNLLWYAYALAVIALLARACRGVRSDPGLGAVTLLSLTTACLLLAIFFCSDYYRLAEDLTTVNRAFLYVAPLAVFVVMLTFAGQKHGQR